MRVTKTTRGSTSSAEGEYIKCCICEDGLWIKELGDYAAHLHEFHREQLRSERDHSGMKKAFLHANDELRKLESTLVVGSPIQAYKNWLAQSAASDRASVIRKLDCIAEAVLSVFSTAARELDLRTVPTAPDNMRCPHGDPNCLGPPEITSKWPYELICIHEIVLHRQNPICRY